MLFEKYKYPIIKIPKLCYTIVKNQNNLNKRHRVVLVRHGQSEWNSQNKFTGWYDVKLTPKGKMEAIRIGKMFYQERIKFDVAFSSVMTRSLDTLNLILKQMKCMNIPVHTSWRLNERHYGDLTGRNKVDIIENFGASKVREWRRHYESVPPAITPNNPYYFKIFKDQKYKCVEIPKSESLKLTTLRVIPYWKEMIEPAIRDGKRVLVCAHGNSLRGIVKYLSGTSDQDIPNVELPTAFPFCYILDEKMKPVGKDFHFLADQRSIDVAMEFLLSESQKGTNPLKDMKG